MVDGIFLSKVRTTFFHNAPRITKFLIIFLSLKENLEYSWLGVLIISCMLCFFSKLAENVMDFGDIAAQRRAVVGQTLSLFQWVFMEALGFITFIAILLVDASSPKCELAMCMTTAFCVALLTLVVADGDDPYHGFIRVCLRF